MTKCIFLISYIMPHGYEKRMSRRKSGIKITCFVLTPRLTIGRRKSSTTVSLFIRRTTANEKEEVKWTGNFSATTNRVARMGKGRRPCDAIPTYSTACHESWGAILRLRTPFWHLGEVPCPKLSLFRQPRGRESDRTPAWHCITK